MQSSHITPNNLCLKVFIFCTYCQISPVKINSYRLHWEHGIFLEYNFYNDSAWQWDRRSIFKFLSNDSLVAQIGLISGDTFPFSFLTLWYQLFVVPVNVHGLLECFLADILNNVICFKLNSYDKSHGLIFLKPSARPGHSVTLQPLFQISSSILG